MPMSKNIVHRHWSKDEIDQVRFFAVSALSKKEIAERIGRTHASVIGICQRENIRTVNKTKFSTTLLESPYIVGKRNLLAKTCVGCGRLLPARRFGRWGSGVAKGTWKSRCKSCLVGKQREYFKNKAEADEVFKKKNNDSSKDVRNRLKIYTEKLAYNKGNYWSKEDDDILKDTTLSILQVAVQLGRTHAATQTRATSLGVQRRSNPDQHKQWVILLDRVGVEKAVEMERAGLIDRSGVPTEADWEWDDVG